MQVKHSSRFLGVDSDNNLVGWAFHSLKTETVEIYIDGKLVGEAKANQPSSIWPAVQDVNIPFEAANKLFKYKLSDIHINRGERTLDIRLPSGTSIDGLPQTSALISNPVDVEIQGVIRAIHADGRLEGWVAEPNHTWSRPLCKLVFDNGEEMAFQAGSFQDKPQKNDGQTGFGFRLRIPSHLCTDKQLNIALLYESSDGWTLLDRKSAYLAPQKTSPEAHVYRRNHRYVIIDPSLKQKKGHVLGVVERLETHCRKRGIPLAIYANKDFPDSSVGETEVHRVFKHSMYDVVDQKGLGSAIANLNMISSSLKSGLETVFEQQGSLEKVIVLYPTVNHFMFKALGSTLRSKSFENNELHCVNLMLETGIAQRDQEYIVEDQMQASIWQSGFQDLAKIKKNVVVGAMSETLRLAAQQLSENPVASFPAFLGIDAEIERLQQSKKMRIGLYLGEIKADKGFFNLPDVIRDLDKKYSNLEILVQAVTNENSPSYELAAKKEISELSAICRNDILIVDSFVEAKPYAEMLLGCDAIVIGYDPKRYAAKTSGVFWEAQSAGIPVVVPSNTWLSQEAELSGLSHVCIETHTAKDLFKALTTMITKINKQGLPKLRSTRQARRNLTDLFISDIERRFYGQANEVRISRKIGQKGLVELQTNLTITADSFKIAQQGAEVINLPDNQKAFLVRDKMDWTLALDQSRPIDIVVTGSCENRPSKLKNFKVLMNGTVLTGKYLVLNKTYWRYKAHVPSVAAKCSDSVTHHAEPIHLCLSVMGDQENEIDTTGMIVQKIELQEANLPTAANSKKNGALK